MGTVAEASRAYMLRGIAGAARRSRQIGARRFSAASTESSWDRAAKKSVLKQPSNASDGSSFLAKLLRPRAELLNVVLGAAMLGLSLRLSLLSSQHQKEIEKLEAEIAALRGSERGADRSEPPTSVSLSAEVETVESSGREREQ